MDRGPLLPAIENLGGRAVAERVLETDREQPIVVVARNSRTPEAAIDARWIADQLEGLSTVYVVNSRQVHDFCASMPTGSDVYGNAVRVYEPEAFHTDSGSRFRSRPAFSAGQANWAMRAAVEDALRCVRLPTPAKERPAQAVPVTTSATVRSFMSGGTHALAQSTNGLLLTVDGTKTVAGVRLDWVLHEGQVVEGLVVSGTSELDLTGSVLHHRTDETYSHGQTVLALAHDVTKDSVNLTLFPGSTWPVHLLHATEDGENPLATEGEVVCALFYIDKGDVKLSLGSPDPEAVIAAPPLVKGGRPWLLLGRDLKVTTTTPVTDNEADEIVAYEPNQDLQENDPPPPEDTDAELNQSDNQPPQLQVRHNTDVAVPHEGRTPAPRPTGRQDLIEKNLEATLWRTQKDLDLAYKESNQLRVQLSQALMTITKLQTDNSALKKRQRALARAAETAASSDELFLDPKDALRHEIYSIWASYIPPEEKDRYPAPQGFEIGDALPESLNKSTDAATREKALETIVDLLVWREERRRSLVKKPFRTGSGSKPQLMRADGSTAWRVRVENHTSQALRMMYWQRPDKTIELATVNNHDDYTVQ